MCQCSNNEEIMSTMQYQAQRAQRWPPRSQLGTQCAKYDH